MTQSGNGAASESYVTYGTGQELNFDDDTLKGFVKNLNFNTTEETLKEVL